MRVNINMSEELVIKVDEIAKKMYISRSAYIAMAVVAKMQQDNVMENIPDILNAIREMKEKKIAN